MEPGNVESSDPHDPPFTVGDGPPTVGADAPNVIGGGDFPVNADFDQDDGDFGGIASNIIV